MLTNKKRMLSLRLLLPIFLILVSFVLCIGYATVSDTLLNVNGNAVAMMQKGVFITDIQYKTGNSVNVDSGLLKVVRGTLLNSSIELSPTNSDSYITYTITFLNNDDYAYEFRKVVFDESFYDNSNIEVYLTDYTLPGTIIEKNGTLSVDIRFQYKSGVTASTLINKLNAYVNLEFVPIAMLKATAYNDTTAFRNAAYKEKIKTITFEKGIGVPTTAVDYWDIGVTQTENVMAYVVANSIDSNYYDLYIQSETQLYANEYMRYWFQDFKNVDSIDQLNLLDTSYTTDMTQMFYNTGYNSTSFTLDLSKFNTSKVTNMSYMFFGTGYKSKVFTLDVSSFDTSNVTSMSFMFYDAGYNSTIYDLDVSDFNTSKVTSMRLMFGSSGRNSSIFTLDVSGFDTSNVTDMHGMFSGTGYTNSSFTLDVSGFDTSKVTNMSFMFYTTGYKSTIFTLDVSDFDTSKVTDMNNMFASAGFSNTAFTLDVSNFDTSKVTNMSDMFNNTGHNSLVLHLDVSGFETSNVTNMGEMFKWAGHENPNFELDVSNFNTSNVTNMAEMFRANGIKNPNFALDVSGFDTSKVTDMSWMFYYVGAINEDFVLDLGNWETSSLVKTDSMFQGSLVKTIYASNKFVTSQITSSTNMFTGCSNLVGSSGTVYNSSLTDKSYARIDGGSSAPGYFSSKPEGYSMLSYLEGTGTQYIDTGYSAPEGFFAEAVIIYTNVSANYIVGSHNKSVPYGRNGISLNSNNLWEIGTGDDYTSASFGPSVNVKYRVAGSTVKGDSYISVDGTTVVSNNDTTDRSSYNLWVYHNQYSHNENMPAAYMKLFALKIYDPSKNLIRDFVPCKNPSGEYGLYDRVTNQFYGNIGTGEFTGR